MTTTTIALVTGANKGIGKETARLLAGRPGTTVWLGARDEDRGRAAEAELQADGLDARFLALDVTDAASVAAAAKAVDAEHGRLDVLVNNAGILGPGFDVPPSQVTVDGLQEVFATNVVGAVAVTNAFLPLLRRSAAGRVVNLSSSLGSLTLAQTPGSQQSEVTLLAYNASKSALNMATVLLARELDGTPVKVNAVCPGYCATDLNGHSGHLTAAEGARVVVQAAGLPDDGPTGAFFDLDGPLPW
jgi:NAD(P)-dependent dehydrogenase (short-subunit alcohol dehydrogenase family)